MNAKQALRISRIHLPVTASDVGHTHTISGDKAHYIRNVLRLKKHHPLIFFTQDGHEFCAEIQDIQRHDIVLNNIIKSGAAIEPAKLNITVVQAISAGDRMDYTVQKSAEMGVVKLIPVFSNYCSHKIPANKIDKKRAHWQAIANSACEQSGRCDLVHIATPCLLEDAIKTHGHNGLYLEPTARNKIINLPDDLKADLAVFIGPEGGFSDVEIASFESAGMFGTQLGQRILRTETAAPVILAAVHTLFGDFS